LGGLKLLDEVGQSLQLGEVLVGELVVIDRVDRLGGGAGTSESRSKILTLQGGEVLGDLEVHSSHSSWVRVGVFGYCTRPSGTHSCDLLLARGYTTRAPLQDRDALVDDSATCQACTSRPCGPPRTSPPSRTCRPWSCPSGRCRRTSPRPSSSCRHTP